MQVSFDGIRAVSLSESALESRARRAAKSIGFTACKSRHRPGSVDNHGGFVVMDPATGVLVAGFRYDMSPEEVISWCRSAP